MVTILKRLGFKDVGQRGSHLRLVHFDGRKTTVPLHSGETIGRGLLRKILRDVNLTPEKFRRLK